MPIYIDGREIRITEEIPYAVRVDAVGTISYIGEALAGSATNAAAWRIKKLEEVGNDVTVTWADGNTNFDNIWDNHLTLTYS